MRSEIDVRERLSQLSNVNPEEHGFEWGWYNALHWVVSELCAKCGRNLNNKNESSALGICKDCLPKHNSEGVKE